MADAIGICAFDPRYKISAKHKPLLGKKRFSLSKSKNLSREDSMASSRSSRSTKSLVSKSGGGNGDKNAVVAVKKLKGLIFYNFSYIYIFFKGFLFINYFTPILLLSLFAGFNFISIMIFNLRL